MMVALGVSALLYFSSSGVFYNSGPRWIEKEQEARSRLLSIPILLYHNIDGRGPFSITTQDLAAHFDLLRQARVSVISASELVSRLEKPVPFKDKAAVVTFDDGFYSMYTRLLPLIAEYGYPVTLFVYTDFIYRRGSAVLTWEKLKEMDSRGIDIQCHSKSHADLTELTSSDDPWAKKKLYEELYLSRRVIELYLDKKVEFFAFPYGRYDLHAIHLCFLAGYRRVFSTDYGSNIITRDNYSLRRQHIKSTYPLSFIERLVR
jgi:peptidoglycan/xylan/chitin deacetylase (PgdA/CDA1 family)